MYLGGYKFAGVKVQRGDNEAFESWALNIHKSKIEAFMRANTLSNAGWVLDMNGSSGGLYHDLTLDLGLDYTFNYVTVFKRVNDSSSTTWFAIYTLGKQTKTGTADPFDSVRRSLVQTRLYDDNIWTLGCYATYFIRIGSSRISYSDSLLDLSSSNIGSTPLIPVGNPGTASSADYSDTLFYGWYKTEIAWNQIYFGFAIKEDDVIVFSGDSLSSNSICVTVASGRAFVNSSDSYGCFILNTQSASTGSRWYESDSRSRPDTNMEMPVAVCQDSLGTTMIPVTVSACPLASWNGTGIDAPYQSLSVYGITSNSSGIFSKGIVKVDLLSINMPTANNSSYYAPYAGGNYLAIAKQTSTTSFLGKKGLNGAYYPNNYYATLFVGWDSSNPDITQSSSWILHTES
jgi:hypothetical protein